MNKVWGTIIICLILAFGNLKAQELNCKVSINYSQIQGTNTQVFKTLENAIKEFINEKKWTAAQYSPTERIPCSMNIVVKEYAEDGTFKCELTIQANRAIYNSSYNSAIFNFKDPNFNFTYLEFDPLELRDNIIDNNLVAVLAYYAYLIIGLDMDTQAPMGGTSVLQLAESVVNSAQTLSEVGWKAFDDTHNRHAIINDYISEGMIPLRQAMYDYHRIGMDEMTLNAERSRAKITTTLSLLKKAKENKAMSILPQLFTEIKKEELINIYSKGTQKEKEEVYDILMEANPAQSNDWDKIKSVQ
ncbi:MAG: DUF4835 family protein [Bacteroides sp.]